ncbi:methyltransferase domain-containing protein [Actinoallomurus purpureus]|uniref:class I SAM-dependent methyltransferase n=1 Tax=Actinoallomurus purpureus TaxID=478114 RepID=UPI00209324F5|nr:class I SAM-dependent methyltransferase [Actinoallomurus purpureus]MCO6008422.1 methyltransferase domain-containing protein [Actinoallomurus purpureus]
MDTREYKGKVVETFHRAAPSYDRGGVEFFSPMGRRLVELAAPRATERVLDVGCGRGACLFPAAEVVGSSGKAVGIDIAPGMVEHVRREALERGLGQVEVRLMDAERPEFEEASFDVVTGSFSIIFLPEAASVLPRYARLLIPGGRLAFTSPIFTEDTFPFLPPMFTEIITDDFLSEIPDEWRPRAVARRVSGWLQDESDIVGTLRGAGFREVRILDEVVPMDVSSGRDWVAWSHTQGMRLLWQWLSPDPTRRLEERIVAALEAERDAEGRIRIETPVRYVLAEREGRR